MEAKELRIGNSIFAFDNKTEVTISVLEAIESGYMGGSPYRPIPLTDDLLLNIGGQKDEYGDIFVFLDKKYDLRIYLKDGYVLKTKGHACPLADYPHIKSLHLLQNFVFASTGEELTSTNKQ